MRILLIDDDAGFRDTLRYHVEVEWPDAIVDEPSAASLGHEPSRLPLEGVDVVLLGHPLTGERGLARLEALVRRFECPPVVVFADPSDEFLAVDALKAGAHSYFPKRAVRHGRLIAVLRDALRARRGDADALAAGSWSAPEGGERFGTGRYRSIERLHTTDLSTVYVAVDEQSGERVACKVVQHSSGAAGVRLFERFLLEYEAIAAVRHPHIVRILDLGIADDHAYIVMELFEGGSLADRLERGALDAEHAMGYARQIAAALDAIHSAGILHRDLKPGNVMFRADGTLALIDFGLAKQLRLDASLTGTGQIFGTPHYMSPEQGRARQTDERSDLYALGCILYEMLTGRKPFIANTAMGVIYKHAHSPRPRLGREHAALEPLLGPLWAIDSDERVASAAEWLRLAAKTGSEPFS